MKGRQGLLVTKDTLLHRKYFREMCRLRGFESQYRFPLKDKEYSTQGELVSHYSNPISVWCILNEITEQKTARKLGWNFEQNEALTLLSVPYDLENLQIGCLFTIPSGVDVGEDRLFRVIDMSTIQVYPASITCRVAPEYATEVEKAELKDFKTTTFNLLREG